MRKILYVVILLFAFTAFINPVVANENTPVKREITVAERAEITSITKRVEEIKAMDKSALTKLERKALRKEVKELKKRSDFLSQHVSLSLGAIIIILLLLILIL